MYAKESLDAAETVIFLAFTIGTAAGFFIGACITAIIFIAFKKG